MRYESNNSRIDRMKSMIKKRGLVTPVVVSLLASCSASNPGYEAPVKFSNQIGNCVSPNKITQQENAGGGILNTGSSGKFSVGDNTPVTNVSAELRRDEKILNRLARLAFRRGGEVREPNFWDFSTIDSTVHSIGKKLFGRKVGEKLRSHGDNTITILKGIPGHDGTKIAFTTADGTSDNEFVYFKYNKGIHVRRGMVACFTPKGELVQTAATQILLNFKPER